MSTDLQEAFREAARREFAMVPDENELDYTFSPSFQRKMQRIIRAQVHGYWNMVNTLGKRIAIVAAIILMLLTTAMAIKPIRERVIKFFVEVCDEYFEVTFGEKDSGDLSITSEPMTRYTFTQLPDDYYEAEFLALDTLLWTTWKANDGGEIHLEQYTGTQSFYMDNIANSLQKIQSGTKTITYQTHNEFDSYLWEEYGYVFSLSVFDNLTTEQVVSIIETLEKNK